MHPMRVLGLAIALAGCGFFGSAGPSVKIETIASGLAVGSFSDSTTIQTRPGTVIIESSAPYGQAGFGIDAVATEQEGQLKVNVVTKRLNDGLFILERWYARYRLTIADVEAGDYRLRLLWNNQYFPPTLQFRDVVDTSITVPK